jgi:hypothetical protein
MSRTVALNFAARLTVSSVSEKEEAPISLKELLETDRLRKRTMMADG